MPAPTQLSTTHLSIARWLVANPGQPLTVASKEFGYTVPWLSTLINGDAFQAHLAQMNDSADAMVLIDIPAKMRAVAAKALELTQAQLQMIESVPTVGDREYLKDVAESVLDRLGFGGKGQSLVINNSLTQNKTTVTVVDAHLLSRARATMLKGNDAHGNTIIDSAAQELLPGPSSVDSGSDGLAAAVPAGETSPGPESAGDKV